MAASSYYHFTTSHNIILSPCHIHHHPFTTSYHIIILSPCHITSSFLHRIISSLHIIILSLTWLSPRMSFQASSRAAAQSPVPVKANEEAAAATELALALAPALVSSFALPATISFTSSCLKADCFFLKADSSEIDETAEASLTASVVVVGDSLGTMTLQTRRNGFLVLLLLLLSPRATPPLSSLLQNATPLLLPCTTAFVNPSSSSTFLSTTFSSTSSPTTSETMQQSLSG